MKKLILVNKQDQKIGTETKIDCHLGNGKLHRAFTCVVENNKGEVILTRRSLGKPLWPTFWDLSFSSHPWDGESLEEAVIRRAKEELGISVNSPVRLFKYYYQIKWNEVFSEHEINHFLKLQYNNDFIINKNEISEYKWLKKNELKKFVKENKKEIAEWVMIAINKKLLNL
jgi:isopentenyl-diphosphate Delta-isomerase